MVAKLAFSAMLVLSSMSVIQAAREQDRTRLMMEVPDTHKSEEWGSELAPSLAPSTPHPATSRKKSSATVTPAAVTASPQQSVSPLPSLVGTREPCTNRSSSGCGGSRGPISPTLSLGKVGVESNLFRKKCRNFCERNSKRSCWLVTKPNLKAPCKKNSFLGKKDKPLCCFYVHCLRFRVPMGLPMNWWEHTSVQQKVRKACLG